MTLEPGVYRSDVEGHLLLLSLNPIQVTCLVCTEACNQADHKVISQFEAAVKQFINKHGALDERIANNVLELIPQK